MTWFSRLKRRIGASLYPERASTQTWMLLTFVVFVGIAVVVIGLYMFFVLREDVRTATNQTLYQTAERIAILIDETPSERLRDEYARTIARITELRVTLIREDSVLLDVHGTRLLGDGRTLSHPEIRDARLHGVGFSQREDAPGELLYYTAIQRPSGLLVRIGSPEQPIFMLIDEMQVVLLAGTILAFLLALLGSWIASQRVTGPLQAIAASARSIAEGKIDGVIHVESRAAEFQDLETSLNRMSDSFREKIENLHSMARLQNEFIGNVSHEVRNPIFTVGGYLEALGSPRLTNEQRARYSDKGLANLQRLNNLFNDLIEIARLEYREDLIRAKAFDMQGLLEEVDEMLRPKADEKGIVLLLDNDPVAVHADRNRIRQVMVNLIENAIAYSDEGTVRCRYRQHLDKVRIEVVDTGRGIPEDHLQHIFQRFYRVDPDRSRKSGGTGLGLSIVKQILHAHGEQIHVESTVGRGTRFWFELPLAETEPIQM